MFKQMFKIPIPLYINFFVIFANYWIWKIFQKDLVLGLGLVLMSSFLFLLTYFKFNKKLFVITLFLTMLISLKILSVGYDQNLNFLNVDQEKQLNDRHGYYSVELGKLFQNKLSLRFYKDYYPYISIYENNLFNSLSPNLYFFESHPREREKVGEFPMYPGILMIPFLFGLIQMIKLSKKILSIYFLFSLFVSGFISQNYIFGPVLFFPLINIFITEGLNRIYLFFKK